MKFVSDIDDFESSPSWFKIFYLARVFEKKFSPACCNSGRKNSYGHPSEEVLTRLNNFGIKTLRTDIDGDIKLVSNGKDIKIITKKAYELSNF